MSEHIQPTPPTQPSPTRGEGHSSPSPLVGEGWGGGVAQTQERTPGVLHEREGFNFWLIVKVGGGLIVTAIIIHAVVWGMFVGLEKHNALPNEGASDLAMEDASRPLGQRLENVPPPHVEGIERDSSLLVLRTAKGEEERFFVSFTVNVRIDNFEAKLFALREGQRVTVTYFMPNGVGGAIGVATAVISPPAEKNGKSADSVVMPDVTRTINGTIVRIVPHGVAASREWAETQKDRYGWIDRKKGVAHIPLEAAMEDVLKSSEFRSEKSKRKSEGRSALPSRANSGREAAGGRR